MSPLHPGAAPQRFAHGGAEPLLQQRTHHMSLLLGAWQQQSLLVFNFGFSDSFLWVPGSLVFRLSNADPLQLHGRSPAAFPTAAFLLRILDDCGIPLPLWA